MRDTEREPERAGEGERQRARESKKESESEREQARAREGDRQGGREAERERGPRPFGSSFCMSFLLPLSLSCVNWSSQEGCLFYLRSSLQSSDLPLFYFRGLFPSLSFATTILDFCFLF